MYICIKLYSLVYNVSPSIADFQQFTIIFHWWKGGDTDTSTAEKVELSEFNENTFDMKV